MTAAVPDPRFRDQLIERARWVNSPMAEPWHRDLIAGTTARHAAELCAWAERLAHTYSRSGTLEVTAAVWALLDALDVAEAHVQAAANQRAVEELHPWAQVLEGMGLTVIAGRIRARAAALASPAPAPRGDTL